MNGTVKNLLLDKVVDEEEHKTYYNRNFSTTTVNEKWTTDVSEFHIAAGKLYLSPILDMYNHEIISYIIYQPIQTLHRPCTCWIKHLSNIQI